MAILRLFFHVKQDNLNENLALNLLDSQMFRFKLYIVSNVHPLEVVGRGSETQLQVDDSYNHVTLSVVGPALDVRI